MSNNDISIIAETTPDQFFDPNRQPGQIFLPVPIRRSTCTCLAWESKIISKELMVSPLTSLTTLVQCGHRLKLESRNLNLLTGVQRSAELCLPCSVGCVNSLKILDEEKEWVSLKNVHNVSSSEFNKQRDKRRAIIKRRYSQIVQNWDTLRTSLELIYGCISSKTKLFYPHNRRIVKEYIRFITRCATHGVKAAGKLLSQTTRLDAIMDRAGSYLLNNRDVTKSAMFLASTLSRSLVVPRPSQREIEKDVEEAIERVTTRQPMPSSDVMMRLGRFIDDMFSRREPVKVIPQLPLPSEKACLEQGRRNGGSMIALHLYGPSLRIQNLLAKCEEDVENIPYERYPDLEVHDPMDQKNCIYRIKTQATREIDQLLAEQGFKNSFNRAIDDGQNKRQCAILGLIGREGKIRIATKHTASIVWQARAMTAHLMPYLKKIHQTRSALHNQDILLKNERENSIDLKVFSADLSKATDPISIGLSRFVLDRIVKHIGKPLWWDDAINNVLCKHTVIGHEKETECGALMGLGPSWTILCVLNAFAAADAGAKKGDHSICGDDLIGLWTDETISSYQKNIESLGMKNNYEKSFINPRHGVFCEILVTREPGSHTATGSVLTRLAQACGAEALQNDRGILITDDLIKIVQSAKTHKRIRHLAWRTIKKVSASREFLIPGPLNMGGSGDLRKPNIRTVISYCLRGPCHIIKSTRNDERLSALRSSLKDVPNDSTSRVTPEMLLTSAKAEIEAVRRLNQVPAPTNEVDLKCVRSALRSRLDQVNKAVKDTTSPTQLLEDILSGDQIGYIRPSKALHKTVVREVRHRRYTKALGILRRSWRVGIDVNRSKDVYFAQFSNTQTAVNLNLLPAPGWDSRLPVTN